MKFFVASESTPYRNYFQELRDQYFSETRGIYELNILVSRPPVRGRAVEGEATAMVCKSNGDLQHAALHHDHNNALLLNITANVALTETLFLCSDKHNACPLIIMRNKEDTQQATVMWHLSYRVMERQAQARKSVTNYLPCNLLTSPHFTALNNMLSNENAEILVTNAALLDEELFPAAGQRQLLTLPQDLMIVSSGLEGQVRSYSANYFPIYDKLIISGEDQQEACLWLMNEPFAAAAAWQKIPVQQFKEFINSQDSNMSLFACIEEFLAYNYNLIANGLNSGPK